MNEVKGMIIKMKIALFSTGEIPPIKYGGTERVVYWLAKGLKELGHEITIYCTKYNLAIEDVEYRIIEKELDLLILEKELKEFDIVHFHNKINFEPTYTYLHTMHGNAKDGEFMPNISSFVSHKHAINHGRDLFVHNGIDLDEYEFCEKKSDYFSYLSKISVKYKNLKYALELAKKKKLKLKIGGGWRLSLNSKIKYLGMLDNESKSNLLKNSKGFIFPTNWEEPFGLVTVEALACGTPVITSDKGALPEIVTDKVGFLCKTSEDYEKAIDNINTIDKYYCRKYVEENFSHRVMAKKYEALYKKIINKEI